MRVFFVTVNRCFDQSSEKRKTKAKKRNNTEIRKNGSNEITASEIRKKRIERKRDQHTTHPLSVAIHPTGKKLNTKFGSRLTKSAYLL